MKFLVSYQERVKEDIKQLVVDADNIADLELFMDDHYSNYVAVSFHALDTLLDHSITYRPVYNPEVIATSKLANVEIAASDYDIGGKEVDGIHYFTHDEALEVQESLKHTGWRLPTRSEWVLICEEFGQKDGQLDTKTLYKNLNMSPGGYWDIDKGKVHSRATSGYWWSATSSSARYADHLVTVTSLVSPQYSSNRGNGFALRLVKDVEDRDEGKF